MFARDEEYKGPQGSRAGFTTQTPSLRDGRVFTFHNLYTLDAFAIIDADTDVVAFEQNFATPGLTEVVDGADDVPTTMAFRTLDVARQRKIIDVIYLPPISKARAYRYLELLAQRDTLGFDRLEIWIGADLRASQAYRNAQIIRRALHPGRYQLPEGVADAVLTALRAAGGPTTLGWLKARPGLGDRPEAAIFTLALSQRLRFVDKTRPIDDAFALALPGEAT
jgi:hypothetical protein